MHEKASPGESCTGVWENSGAGATRLTAEGKRAGYSSNQLLHVPCHAMVIRDIWGTINVVQEFPLPPPFNYCQKNSVQPQNSVTLETKIYFPRLL